MLNAAQKNWILTIIIGVSFCILWSSAFIGGKMVVDYAPPLSFLSLRFFLTALILCVILYFMKIKLFLNKQETIIGFILGLLNHAIYLALCWVAFQTSSAGMVAIIAGLNPLLTAFFAWLWLKEPLGMKRVLGLLIGLLGAWWVIFSRLQGGLVVDSTTGIILSFIAMFAFTIGTLIYRRYGTLEGYNPWRLNMWQSVSAMIFLAPMSLSEDWTSIEFNAGFWLLMAYFIFLISITALVLWFILIRRAGAAGASSFHFLNPAMALFFAFIILGETISISEIFGVIPILIGILLVNWPQKAHAP